MQIRQFFANNSLETLFLIFVITGYVFFSALAIPLGIENSRILAVPYRIAVAAFSVFFIWKNRDHLSQASFPVIALIAFWVLYAVKCWYSFKTHTYNPNVLEITAEHQARIFLIALIPSLGLLLLNYKKVDLNAVLKGCFWILLIMLILNALYGLLNMENGRMPHIFSVYYISYGHLGASLALLSIYFLCFQKYSGVLYFIGLLVGLYIIVEGFARSPFLAFVIGSAFLLLLSRRKKLILAFGIAVAAFIVWTYFSVKYGFNQLIFVERMYNWLFEGDNSLRTPLFIRGFAIFRENPVFGGRVLYEDGSYPHNIFIELLMSTGITGLILYFVKFLPLFRTGNYFLMNKANNAQVGIFVLFIQYFVLVFTSYSLPSTPELIQLSAVIIGLSLNRNYEKT